jgi:hypothetical protein
MTPRTVSPPDSTDSEQINKDATKRLVSWSYGIPLLF